MSTVHTSGQIFSPAWHEPLRMSESEVSRLRIRTNRKHALQNTTKELGQARGRADDIFILRDCLKTIMGELDDGAQCGSLRYK
jgi:hypothetical protein